MKTSTSLMAGASRFAHFAGLTRSSGRRRAAEEEDDQPKGKRSRRAADDDDDDEPKGKGSRRAADDDDGDDEPKGKGSRRASDDDDDDGDDEPKGKGSRRASDDDDDDDDGEPKGKGSRRASDDDDDDDDGEPKGKRSRRAAEDDEDEDDEDELNGRSSASRARRREQARIAHILGHKAAANNPSLAVSLACETRMSRRAAVQVLKGQPAPEADDRPRGSRQSRAGRNPRLGSDAAPTGRQSTDASWDAAFAKAGVTAAHR